MMKNMMKSTMPRMLSKSIVALLAAVSFGAVQAAPHNASYGEHGMALFGGSEGLYASHLPMFHAPHDVQVVLQVHLADRAQDRALRARLNGKTDLWTIAPEKFELDRLSGSASDPLRRFKGDLVLGHFEQGGKTQFASATIVVDKVLMYRHLSPLAHASDTARYVQIGSARQRFLVKEIDSRPDFDHIVAIDSRPDAPSGVLEVSKHALEQTDRAALAVALGADKAKVIGPIYFYTDDLR
jgi:hypothetical protein